MSSLKIKIVVGNWLYNNFYPLYNIAYDAFKKKQDKNEISLVKKLIKPGDTILDIGANIGFYTKLFSNLVGTSGKIMSFEPDPINFKYLSSNCGTLKNVLLYNNALSNNTGEITLYTSKKLNVDHRTYKPLEYDKEIKINAIKLDDIIPPQSKIHFIKIDIQGFEVSAFRGMSRIISENPGVKIISEFSPYDLKLAGSSSTEFYNWFLDQSFSCFLLEGNQLKKMDVADLDSINEKSTNKDYYFNVLIAKADNIEEIFG